eukprot:984350-Rhodomonas_salina.3
MAQRVRREKGCSTSIPVSVSGMRPTHHDSLPVPWVSDPGRPNSRTRSRMLSATGTLSQPGVRFSVCEFARSCVHASDIGRHT